MGRVLRFPFDLELTKSQLSLLRCDRVVEMVQLASRLYVEGRSCN